MAKNPLFDLNFLTNLTTHNERETYARITALTKDELPVEYIEGKVTGGSINVDGSSAVRRTCSLTMVAEDVNINDFYWGLKNKFKLEIGLINKINPEYPNIIWFKQGLYIITSFSTSQNTSSYNINISGKDKMCLLNGDISGVLPHSTDFGIEEIVDNKTGIISYHSIPIKTIIREAVQNFGGELAQNIIINDIEDRGLELLEYRGDVPLFLLKDIESDTISNMLKGDSSQKCRIVNPDGSLGEEVLITNDVKIVYDNLVDLEIENEATIIKFETKSGYSKPYTVVKVEYGTIPGYRTTDLTYAGDLIANVGETLTSILDKIKNMLGDFEYFYDIDGRFVFRRKPTYITTPWNSSEEGDEVTGEYYDNIPVFNFQNNTLITSFSNTPNLLNLRNDYAVWGTFKSTSGAELPIHMRYAIDKKPTEYLPIRPLKQSIKTTVFDAFNHEIETTTEDKYFGALDVEPYNTTNMRTEIETRQIANGDNTTIIETTSYYATESYKVSDNIDWREILYQMALDYRKLYHDDDFLYNLAQANPQWPTGKTGYEQYYIDMEGFWRDLYNPNPEQKYYSINYTQAPTAEKLFIKSYYAPATIEEKQELTVETAYVYYENIVKDEEDNDLIIKGIYPFISAKCHLECVTDSDGNKKTRVPYYFKDFEGEFNQGTQSIDILSKVNIKDLYLKELDVNETYKYVNFIEKTFKEYTDTLYVYKPDVIIAYEDLEAIGDSHLLLHTYSGNNKVFAENLRQYTIDKFNNINLKNYRDTKIHYQSGYYDYYIDADNKNFWRKDISESPENLLFWIDFLDAPGSDIDKYSVSTVGIRSKAINDNDVKSIYYREIPTVIFKNVGDEIEPMTGYTYIQLQSTMENLFTISSKGKSAKERIDELLYNHLYCIESASVSAVPVYYLEPNGRIIIQDENSGINGEYIISKMTIPLTYNGTMSLTATKAVSNII